jgi:hypothetical protein
MGFVWVSFHGKLMQSDSIVTIANASVGTRRMSLGYVRLLPQ